MCKYCGKGVCKQCARTEDYGIFCSEKCATVGADHHAMNQRALKLYNIGGGRTPLGTGVVIYGITGLSMLTIGLNSVLQTKHLAHGNWSALSLGLLFIGIAFYVRFRQNQTGLNC